MYRGEREPFGSPVSVPTTPFFSPQTISLKLTLSSLLSSFCSLPSSLQCFETSSRSFDLSSPGSSLLMRTSGESLFFLVCISRRRRFEERSCTVVDSRSLFPRRPSPSNSSSLICMVLLGDRPGSIAKSPTRCSSSRSVSSEVQSTFRKSRRVEADSPHRRCFVLISPHHRSLRQLH